MKKTLALVLLAALSMGLPLQARAQDKPAPTTAGSEASGPPTLTSVGQGKLSSYLDRTVKASGIVGSYLNEAKTRYRFSMDDGSSVVVVGTYPDTGGARYDLTARVSRSAGGIELQEISKAPASGGGGGKVDPLLLGGAALLVVAAGAFAVMAARSRAERERARLEEIRKARDEEEKRWGNARPDPSLVGPGSTQVAGTAPRQGTLVSIGRVLGISGPHEGASFPLLDHRTPIGRDAEGGVKIDRDPTVSGQHAEILITPDRRIYFEDKSRNGSMVNGKALNGSRVEVEGPFEFTIGGSTFRVEPYFSALRAGSAPSAAPGAGPSDAGRIVVEEPPAGGARRAPTLVTDVPPRESVAHQPTGVGYAGELEQTGGTGSGTRHAVTKESTTIGREDCDVTLEDLSVSRRHAILEIQNGTFVLKDANSTHGTSVNGNPVGPGGYELRDGDEIVFGRSPERMRFRGVAS